MARLYIDSNIFFYAKVGDRVFGKPCAQILKRIDGGELQASISVLVPLEVGNALRKFGLGKVVEPELAAILSLGMEVLPLESSDLGEVGGAFRETGVSPYDCAHAVLMKRYGITEIVSADRDFERFKWLVRTDPRRLP